MLYTRLLRELRSAKDDVSKLILRGNSEDYATYKYLLGRLKGIDEAIEITIETLKGDEDED